MRPLWAQLGGAPGRTEAGFSMGLGGGGVPGPRQRQGGHPGRWPGLAWPGSQGAQAQGWEGPLHAHCPPGVPPRSQRTPFWSRQPAARAWPQGHPSSPGARVPCSVAAPIRHCPHFPHTAPLPPSPNPLQKHTLTPPPPQDWAGGAVHSGKPRIINHTALIRLPNNSPCTSTESQLSVSE